MPIDESEMTMPKTKYGTPNEENPEWTGAALRTAKRLADFPELARIVRKHRGPQRTPTKIPVNLRLDRDVVTHARASGRGWQGRINAALKRAIARGTL